MELAMIAKYPLVTPTGFSVYDYVNSSCRRTTYICFKLLLETPSNHWSKPNDAVSDV